MGEWVETRGSGNWAGATSAGMRFGATDGARCAAEGCGKGAELHLAGKGVCGAGHLALLMRDAIAKEQRYAARAYLRVRQRIPIGQVLLRQGAITEPALAKALCMQEAAGAGRIGSWLRQTACLTEEALTDALAAQEGCGVLPSCGTGLSGVTHAVPRPLLERLGGVPVLLDGSPTQLTLAFESRIDFGLLRAVEQMHGIRAAYGLLPGMAFWQAKRDALGVAPVPVEEWEADSVEAMAAQMSRKLVESRASAAALVAVRGCYWLRFIPGGAPKPCDLLCGLVGGLESDTAGGTRLN